MSTGPGTAGHPDQDPAADGPGGDWAPAAGEAGPAGAGPRDTELVAARWRQWRHGRPFWGGVFVVAGAAVTLLSERAPLPLIVHIGVQGVAGYLVPVMLLVCGLLLWFHPAPAAAAAAIDRGIYHPRQSRTRTTARTPTGTRFATRTGPRVVNGAGPRAVIRAGKRPVTRAGPGAGI